MMETDQVSRMLFLKKKLKKLDRTKIIFMIILTHDHEKHTDKRIIQVS